MKNPIGTDSDTSAVNIQDVRILHVTTVAKTLGFLVGQVAFMKSRGFSLYSAGGEARGVPRNWPLPFSTVEMPRRITPLRDLVAIYRLARVIARIDPTIVQGHTPKGGLLTMIAAAINRVPVRIFQVHGLPHTTARGIRRTLLILATRVSCGLANRVFCVSQSMRKVLVEEKLCRPDKAFVLGNGSSGGVDPQRFGPGVCKPETGREFRQALSIPEAAVVAGFAGRIVRDKGIIELTQAWMSLRTQFPDLHLIVAGEAETQDPVPAKTREILTNDPRVHMIGQCENMARFYSACDFIVLPTYREGMANVLLEAAAMGLPSVATRVPGCTDAVVDGVTGSLVPPYDPPALATAMARYVTDPELRRLHGAAGKTHVLRDFQPKTIYLDLYSHYCDLLGSGTKVSPVSPPGRGQRGLKRICDLAIAGLGLVTLFPLLAVIAAVIRVTSGGSVLFRQVRPGSFQQPFTIYKFQTMSDAVDSQGNPLPDSERLHALGRFLRRTSLDELPELWNVLLGDMSLVGPRPLLMKYLPFFTEEERVRFTVRPGITGWAQVNGRNEARWNDRLQKDMWYVRNRSLLLDFRILWMTAVKTVRCKQAIPDARSVMQDLDEERAVMSGRKGRAWTI